MNVQDKERIRLILDEVRDILSEEDIVQNDSHEIWSWLKGTEMVLRSRTVATEIEE